MAEAFGFFPIQRTMCNMTFYIMEGRNFVRKKSSLTRRKVLYSPQFERTRHNASVMGQASKIGSFLFNSLPVRWRQSWMYRTFTGEAYKMLKKGKTEREIRLFLWDLYIKDVVDKADIPQSSSPEPAPIKREYKKKNTSYWETKTRKSIQRKTRKQQRIIYSNLLAEASKMASELYQEMPAETRNRSHYQQLTAWAMQFLKEQEQQETEITPVALEPAPDHITQVKQQNITDKVSYINCKKGVFYFIPSISNRFCCERPASLSLPLRFITICHNNISAAPA